MKNTLLNIALCAALGIVASQSFAAPAETVAGSQMTVAREAGERPPRKDGKGDDRRRVIDEATRTPLIAREAGERPPRKDGKGDDRRRVIDEATGTPLIAREAGERPPRKDGKGDDRRRAIQESATHVV